MQNLLIQAFNNFLVNRGRNFLDAEIEGVWIFRLNILLFFSLLVYMTVIGGDDGSKILWVYIFPITAFFLLAEEMIKRVLALRVPHNGSRVSPYVTMSFGIGIDSTIVYYHSRRSPGRSRQGAIPGRAKRQKQNRTW